MKGAIAVEPVLVALAHGIWFLPAIELVPSRILRPADRVAVREAGWLVYAAVLVASPLQDPILGLGGWVPGWSILVALTPGLWGLARWAAAWRSLVALPTTPWTRHQGVEVQLADVPGPLTFGVARPRIVLPRDAPTWPASRLRAVLGHEAAHVARGDLLRRALANAVGVVLAVHPVHRWSLRRHARAARPRPGGPPRRARARAAPTAASRLRLNPWSSP